MSEIGYYRYKIIADSDKDIVFLKDSVITGVKSVEIINDCARNRVVKYLDKNGQYRYYPFESYGKSFDSPQKIGSVNKTLTNILSDQSSTSNVGYKNNQLLTLIATVTSAELEKLIDIYTSPRVYLYIGDFSTDLSSDYLEVEIESSDNVISFGKQNAGVVNITLKLPENYSITML